MMNSQNKNKNNTRENTPLIFILTIIIPLYGSYYNFTNFVIGAFLCGLMYYEVNKEIESNMFSKNKINYNLLNYDVTILPIISMAIGYFISIFFAVSGGMAFTGFLRILVLIAFYFYSNNYYSKNEKEYIINFLAYEGVALSLFTIIGFFYEKSTGIENINGRIDGFFQYANTWSLYLLIAFIIILSNFIEILKNTKNIILNVFSLGILITGIFLTGSRATIILMILSILIIFISNFIKNKKYAFISIIGGITGFVTLGIFSNFLSEGLIFERLLSLGSDSYSLNGRILYFLDGLDIVYNNIMGIGYGGYIYAQPIYQKGIYTLAHVHNEYLQMFIEGGLIAGISFIVFTLLTVKKTILSKNISIKYKLVILVIFLHIFIDFDLQFMVIYFIIILVNGISTGVSTGISIESKGIKGTKYIENINMNSVKRYILIPLTLCFSYFGTVYYFDYYGNSKLAYKLFPSDLSISDKRLQSCETFQEAEEIAYNIIDGSDFSLLAWDCLYNIAVIEENLEEMAINKYEYLKLNAYRYEVYEDMVNILEKLYLKEPENEVYEMLREEVSNLLQEVKEKTRPIAYKIYDTPDFLLNEDNINNILYRLNF